MSEAKPSESRPATDTALLREMTVDLEPVVDELAAEIAEAMQRELPQALDDPGTVAEVRAASRSSLDYFIALVQDGADVGTVRLPPETERWVRHFARRGVELGDLFRAVRLGHAMFWRRWLVELRLRYQEPDALAEAIDLGSQQQFAYADAMATAMAAAHAEEREQWVRSAAAIRADVVRTILDQAAIDTDAASTRLGYALRREHAGIVLWADEDGGEIAAGEMEQAARAVSAAVGEGRPLLVPLNGFLLAGWVGGATARALDDLSSTTVSEATKGRFGVAVGIAGEGVDGFRRTHLEAMRARRVALCLGRRPGTITRYSRVALTSLASADLEEARSLVERELGPLASDEDDMLRLAATLRVYFEEGSSLERAARRLGVHKNTVNNRVRRARELIGSNLDERPLEVQVALLLSRIVRSTGDEAQH
jgi:DNA-binding PucR family transcriptional regulator